MKMRFFLVTLAAVALSYVTGCTPVRHNLPPAQRMLEPGPGVGGPGPGVMAPGVVPASANMPMDDGGGACGPGGPGYGMMAAPAVQILFNRPEGMEVLYDVVGDGSFTSNTPERTGPSRVCSRRYLSLEAHQDSRR